MDSASSDLHSSNPVLLKNAILRSLNRLQNTPAEPVTPDLTDKPEEVGLQYLGVAVENAADAHAVARFINGLLAGKDRKDLRPVQIIEDQGQAQLVFLADPGIEMMKSFRDLVFDQRIDTIPAAPSQSPQAEALRPLGAVGAGTVKS